MGLHTLGDRLLTLKGVKPRGQLQGKFKALWLYGLGEPLTGESFFYEFCQLDTICFEKFLELFAQAYPDEAAYYSVRSWLMPSSFGFNYSRERYSLVSTSSLSRNQSN